MGGKFFRDCLITVLVLGWAALAGAAPATREDCRPLSVPAAEEEMSLAHADAVLWKVSRAGPEPSYLFGTIHVADPKIIDLPVPVRDALNVARVFVMEALPIPDESMKLSRMMYFNDGKKLRDYLDHNLYQAAAKILDDYQVPPQSLDFLKPWAAFIIMSYPRGAGTPLDLALLDIAQRNNLETRGLETLTEQGHLFNSLDLPSQVQLLLDTLCNYDEVNGEYEVMKSLYLRRDLGALYNYSIKNSFSGDRLYEDLYRRLLTDRNRIMAQRMQPILAAGNAFIAIGAMHLPGAEGVLSLLERQGYTITAIY